MTTRRPPPRLLLVDSNPQTARVLALLLTGDGFEVDVATDGLSALSSFARLPLPDALICALRVGQLDAQAVARHARAHKPTLPVFVLTHDARLVAAVLCDPPPLVFTKPIDYPTLLSAISDALERRQTGN